MAKRVKQQLKIALPAKLRAEIEAVAAQSGFSLAEEIRSRVERTFKQDSVDRPTRDLLAFVEKLSDFVRLDTGKEWHAHAAAQWALRFGITAYLQRNRPAGDRMFKPGELPSTRLVGSDDPEGIGIGLESAIFHLPPPDEERLLAWQAKAFEKMAGLSPDIAKAAKAKASEIYKELKQLKAKRKKS
jgi:hypothetical protein